MTRSSLGRTLRRAYWILGLVLAISLVAKLANQIPGLADTPAERVLASLYDYLKDMALVLVTVVAASVLAAALVDAGTSGRVGLSAALLGGSSAAVALRALGDLLILGKGIGQDKPRGVELLQQAAAQDFVPALLSLGYSFEFGDGVPVDATRAMEFYTRAGDAGLVRAQLILADHYQRGLGTPADDFAAFGWLSRAAESGDPEANYLLGVAYLEGRGTNSDVDAAVRAFQVSSDGYSPRGSTALGYMTELGLGGLQADPDAAQGLYYSGEGARVPAALHNLARLGEADDPAQARERYERAARAGQLSAAVNLGLMMLTGAGGPQDVAGAFHWTRKAADGGNAAGLNNLGRLYELGLGVAADPAEARRLYGAAAALAYTLAVDNLDRLGN